MKRRILTALVAGSISLWTAAPALADSAPVKLDWNGFVQGWAGLGENKLKDDENSGFILKHARLRLDAEAYDGLDLVLLPELAGGTFTLLDAYAAFHADKYLGMEGLPLTLTLGQFKTPFGLNRMYSPTQLAVIDYSPVSNAVMGTNSFWDDGLMLTWKQGAWLRLDAAWLEGLGPNLSGAGVTALGGYGDKPNQDAAARLELYPAAGLSVGGSLYYGEAFTSNTVTAASVPAFPGKPQLVGGLHVKYARPGKSFDVEAELLNRSALVAKVANLGVCVLVSQYVTGALQLALEYDHASSYLTNASDSTAYTGGVNYYPGGPVKLSLMQVGKAGGPSQRPSSTQSVLQAQVTF